MDRRERDLFTSGTGQADLTTGNACWETPPAIFAKLVEDFGGFDVDLTADPQRALCRTWFGPYSPEEEYDALTAKWHRFGRRGYSNPPYGPFVQKLLAKAKAEAQHEFVSVLLLPMRVTVAFRAHVLSGAAQLLFCDKRLTFWENGAPRINPKTGKADPAVFDSILVVYRPGICQRPMVGEWHVPPHVTAEDIERGRAKLRAA